MTFFSAENRAYCIGDAKIFVGWLVEERKGRRKKRKEGQREGRKKKNMGKEKEYIFLC